MSKKYTDDELATRVKTPGWLLTRNLDRPITGTLQHLLNLAHQRKRQGEHPGLIQEIETSVELDMIAVEKLWRFLGLPV
ncbi:MAG TPA: hypothetical protein VII48_05225 [Rhizomicrobium sp.]